MKSTTTVARIRAAAALAVLALMLTACGGGGTKAPEATSSAGTDTAETAKPDEPAVEGFAVGKPFGDAEWSVALDPSSTSVVDAVRPDRVIVTTTTGTGSNQAQTLHAYTDQGEEAWTHDVPQFAEVGVLETSVAVLAKKEVEGSGLDTAKTVTELTLLSQDDGSVITEKELPDDTAGINDLGSIVYRSADDLDVLSLVSEDGKVTELNADQTDVNDAGFVGDVPFWLTKDNSAATNVLHGGSWTLSEFPGIDEEIFEMDVLAVDNRLGLIVVQAGHGATDALAYFAVRAETGEVAYEFDCPDYSHTNSSTNIANSSPDGEYGVHESIRLSASKARCFGGGDGQKSVELQTVDDDGTAYGLTDPDTTEDHDLVVIPSGGEPEISDAPIPAGIMDGGIAVHLVQSTITGNPIK